MDIQFDGTAARTSILSCEANTLEEGSGYKFRVREERDAEPVGGGWLFDAWKNHPICIVGLLGSLPFISLISKSRNWGTYDHYGD